MKAFADKENATVMASKPSKKFTDKDRLLLAARKKGSNTSEKRRIFGKISNQQLNGSIGYVASSRNGSAINETYQIPLNSVESINEE